MTEADWLKCSDVEEMLHYLWDLFPDMKWEDRKPTLLFCACGKLVQHLLPAEYGQLLIEMENWADGLTMQEEIKRVAERAERAVARLGQDQEQLMFSLGQGDLGLFGYIEAQILSAAARTDFDEMQKQVDAQHCDFVRDIFGNPLANPRPSGFWLQDSVVRRLAQEIYTGHAFDRLPELADSLEKAGCTSEEALAHCRGSGMHVRGCWVIDLLRHEAAT